MAKLNYNRVNVNHGLRKVHKGYIAPQSKFMMSASKKQIDYLVALTNQLTALDPVLAERFKKLINGGKKAEVSDAIGICLRRISAGSDGAQVANLPPTDKQKYFLKDTLTRLEVYTSVDREALLQCLETGTRSEVSVAIDEAVEKLKKFRRNS